MSRVLVTVAASDRAFGRRQGWRLVSFASKLGRYDERAQRIATASSVVEGEASIGSTTAERSLALASAQCGRAHLYFPGPVLVESKS